MEPHKIVKGNSNNHQTPANAGTTALTHRPVGGGGNTVSTLLLSTGLPDSRLPRFPFLTIPPPPPPAPIVAVRGLFGGRAGGAGDDDGGHIGRQANGEEEGPLAPALSGFARSAGE